MFTQDEMETILYVLEDHAQDNANEYMVRKINAICDKMNEVIVPMPIAVSYTHLTLPTIYSV